MPGQTKPPMRAPGLQASKPLANGLVLLMPTWEAGGNTAMDVARGNTGTLTDSDMWSVGDQGPVLKHIRGEDDYVAFSFIPELANGGDITISMWVKMTDLTGFQWLMHQYSASLGRGPALLLSGNELQWSIGVDFLAISGKLIIGQWNHVVCTAVGTLLKIYIDGKLVASGTKTRAETSDATFNIGGPDGFAGVSSLAAESDMPVVWARAISLSEAQTLYEDRFALIRPAPMPIVVGTAITALYPHVPGMTGGIAV